MDQLELDLYPYRSKTIGRGENQIILGLKTSKNNYINNYIS